MDHRVCGRDYDPDGPHKASLFGAKKIFYNVHKRVKSLLLKGLLKGLLEIAMVLGYSGVWK
jgi:hypothetical protein